jgi:hypothetical protein
LARPEGRVERLALDAVPLAFRDEDAAPEDVRERLLGGLGLVVDVAVLQDVVDRAEVRQDQLRFLSHTRSASTSLEREERTHVEEPRDLDHATVRADPLLGDRLVRPQLAHVPEQEVAVPRAGDRVELGARAEEPVHEVERADREQGRGAERGRADLAHDGSDEVERRLCWTVTTCARVLCS